ncbi:hypothetical protein VFPPC_09297 [Pochonia chlamydosporia 170]|uniref:Uncharacterized protein n=1 Tax=Pochonia chlamydosporia 170 TaxID=1380566 RepID=A0A179F8H0_METCM|nr:hypothetical protein VFPPC_09297 [Pochonia chlamydosporia 170]OAQ61463.2 hypothetical protein VFPPC_09297 [Pochonia chlamydosporia 170]
MSSNFLSHLPLEILQGIAKEVCCPGSTLLYSLTSHRNKLPIEDLRSLSSVSKSIRHGIKPVLFYSAAIDIFPTSSAEGEPYFSTAEVPGSLPGHLHRLTFQNSSHEECVHELLIRGAEDPERWEEITCCSLRMNELGHRVLKTLKNLQAEQLHSFRYGRLWRLGLCVPNEVFGVNGILQRNHGSSIRHLELVTQLICNGARCIDINLSAFDHLRSLTWQAPNAAYMHALAEVVRINAPHLQKLELDFVDWEELKDGIGYDQEDTIESGGDYFANHILRLNLNRQPSPFLGNIQVLSLCHVPLTSTVAHHINTFTLRSLSIRKCWGCEIFFNALTTAKPGISLRAFEFQGCWGTHYSPFAPLSCINSFLGTFHGLYELVLCFCGKVDAVGLWENIAKTHTGIRRLIVQEYGLETEFEEPYDYSLPFNRRQGRGAEVSHEDAQSVAGEGGVLSTPLASLPLEFLGVCSDFESPVDISDSLPTHWPRLKMIHFRFTVGQIERSEAPWHLPAWNRKLSSFLKKVFGRDGHPCLEAVAFGDVAADKNTRIYYRNRGGQGKPVQNYPTNSEQKDLVRKYERVLAACPTGSTISSTEMSLLSHFGF